MTTKPTHKLFPGYKPHAKQKAFHRSKARFKILTAGARAGKTYAAAREFIRRIWEDRAAKEGRLRYWVVAPNYSLVLVAIQEVATILNGNNEIDDPVPNWVVKNWNKSSRILVLNGDVTITFKSAANPLTLVSAGLDGFWIDEAARMKAEAWRGNLRMRISDRDGWAILSTTPLGKNWYYDDIYLLGCRDHEFYSDQYENFHFKTADNTSRPNLVDEVKRAKLELPKAYYMREYEASFDTFVGQIYEELEEIHLVDEVPRGIRFVRHSAGFDFGWNQAAYVNHGIDQFGDWWLLKSEQKPRISVVADDKHTMTWAKKILEDIGDKRGLTVYGDSADPEGIHSLRRSGVPIRKAEKAVIRGIDYTSALIHPVNGKPRYHILKSCKNAYDQLLNYQWDEHNDVIIDRPAPNQIDHLCDAIRYACYSDYKRFGEVGQLQTVKVGGF